MQQDPPIQQIQQMQQPTQQQATGSSILGLAGMSNFTINTTVQDQSNQQQPATPLKDAQQVQYTPNGAGSNNNPNVVPPNMIAAATAQFGQILSAGVNAAQGGPVIPPQPTVMTNMLHSGLPGQPGGPGSTNKRSQRQQKAPKAKVMPTELEIEGPTSNEAYQAALNDQNLTVSPQALGFLPSNYWLNLDSTFGDLVTKFFQRKNNANCRFPHKLYNALAIVDQDPKMYNLLGVKWITNEIFKVDKLIFGRVLGISSIDGGLFHRQGNFPSHGFREVSSTELAELKNKFGAELADVDQERIRLLYHEAKMFTKTSNEDSVTKCRWANNDKKEE